MGNYMTIASGFVLMAFSFLSGVFIKKFGRKPIFLVGELVMIIILGCTGVASLLSRH